MTKTIEDMEGIPLRVLREEQINMSKIVERINGNVEIETCVYQEDYFHLVKISQVIAESKLFVKAVYGSVLNINALYKHFVDDNFEHHQEVEDHFIQEVLGKEGMLHISMGSLDEEGNVLKEHQIVLQYKDFS